MRHLISLKEQSAEDLTSILAVAAALKEQRKRGIPASYLPLRTLLMLFQKPSTRTRVSFEAAMTELGGHAVFLDARTTQFTLAEFKDEVRALMRFGDVLMFRALRAADVALAAAENRIPVIDGCSEKYHPAQALGDILTMSEDAGGIENVRKIAWLGIENNVSNTLSLACAKLGIEVVIAAPEADPASTDQELYAMRDATGKVRRVMDLKEALAGTRYVHTDTWMNMEFFENGAVKPAFADEYERRKKVFLPYQLSRALIDGLAPEAKVMHCMPCHVGYEITRDAIDHPNSLIFDQAENRLHVEKAILLWLLEREGAVRTG